MKKSLVAVIALSAVLLSGCIIVPAGPGYGPGWGYRHYGGRY